LIYEDKEIEQYFTKSFTEIDLSGTQFDSEDLFDWFMRNIVFKK
jgi:hypothetical protein